MGPGGIGKTAIAAEALWNLASAGKLQERFPDGVIFHSFYDQPEVSVALEAVARAYGEEPHPNPATAARRALAGRQALLVLDGSEGADDLNKVLAVRGGCGVLITSRTRRDVIEECQDVNPLPDAEAIQLLSAWGGHRASDELVAQQICELVGCLPLAVRLVGHYLTRREEDCVDYLAWLEETPLAALDLGRRQQDSVRLLLHRAVSLLSERAQQALSVVGILALSPFEREAVASALQIQPNEAGRLLGEAVEYGLLLREGLRYKVSHALVHTYAREEIAPSSTAIQYLSGYYEELAKEQSALGSEGYPVLGAERTHLIAIIRVCLENEDWKRILNLVLSVDSYLDLQGYWSERLAALEIGLIAARMLGFRRDEEVLLTKIGITSVALGQVKQALGIYQQALIVCREIEHRQDEGIVLGNLGDALSVLGKTEEAIDRYLQALAIAKETGDRLNEGNWMGRLGSAYRVRGRMDNAINYYQQALLLAREIGDRRGEQSRLGNLGTTLHALGHINEAVDYYQQALTIARDIGDRHGEGAHLGNLGLAHINLGKIEKAIECFQQSLKTARKIGDRRGENTDLGNLGSLYLSLGQAERAIHYYQQALAIACELGDQLNEGNWLGNLGIAYRTQGQTEKAIDYYERALVIARKIGDRYGEGVNLANLGIAYHFLDDVEQSIACEQQALAIAREMHDRYGEGYRLGNLGTVYDELQQLNKSVDCFREALIIAHETGDEIAQKTLLRQLQKTRLHVATKLEEPSQTDLEVLGETIDNILADFSSSEGESDVASTAEQQLGLKKVSPEEFIRAFRQLPGE